MSKVNKEIVFWILIATVSGFAACCFSTGKTSTLTAVGWLFCTIIFAISFMVAGLGLISKIK